MEILVYRQFSVISIQSVASRKSIQTRLFKNKRRRLTEPIHRTSMWKFPAAPPLRDFDSRCRDNYVAKAFWRRLKAQAYWGLWTFLTSMLAGPVISGFINNVIYGVYRQFSTVWLPAMELGCQAMPRWTPLVSATICFCIYHVSAKY